jgi:hypothetical protein
MAPTVGTSVEAEVVASAFLNVGVDGVRLIVTARISSISGAFELAECAVVGAAARFVATSTGTDSGDG